MWTALAPLGVVVFEYTKTIIHTMRTILRSVGKKLIQSKKYKVRLRFADGSELTNCKGGGEPDIVIHFKTRKAEWFSVLFFYEGIFDEYVAGNVDIEGDNPLTKLMDLGFEIGILAPKGEHNPHMPHPIYSFKNPLQGMRSAWQQFWQNNQNYAQAKKNAEYHYAIHPKLFEYMLGPTVGYCEGYWVEGTKTLDQAKHNVYEYICKKLRLEPGMHVVDVGAGWGFLPIFMAKNYGVNVTVYNPVKRQNDYMQKRFEDNGVADKIRVVEGEHHDIMKEAGSSTDLFRAACTSIMGSTGTCITYGGKQSPQHSSPAASVAFPRRR